MKLVYLVALLAIAQYLAFGMLVGRARERHGVKAPAISGHPEFERLLRVQTNTLEQLIAFLPVLFIAAQFWSPVLVAAAGVVYLAGRTLYWRAYVADPARRALGFLLTVAPIAILMLAGFAGILIR